MCLWRWSIWENEKVRDSNDIPSFPRQKRHCVGEQTRGNRSARIMSSDVSFTALDSEDPPACPFRIEGTDCNLQSDAQSLMTCMQRWSSWSGLSSLGIIKRFGAKRALSSKVKCASSASSALNLLLILNPWSCRSISIVLIMLKNSSQICSRVDFLRRALKFLITWSSCLYCWCGSVPLALGTDLN